jgi:hypothetical protein
MPISPNEIKSRAIKFANDWKDESRERAEKDTFWNEFFHIFGIERKRVADFEKYTQRLGNKKGGFIDVFWPGILICEHKSKGEDLDKAQTQSSEYLVDLSDEEYPNYAIVSDFENIRLEDKQAGKVLEIKTENLPEHLDSFKFMGGQISTIHENQEMVNIQAAELMGQIHDDLFEVGYHGHDLEIFLVRLLFILFAEDTNIFEKSIFTDYLINRTNKDGSDLGSQIKYIFEILNKPEEERLKNLDEDLARFCYINGGLFAFARNMETPQFDSKMRQTLIKACKFNWSGISPAIFGSLFQYVMDKDKRRSFGAHYTEEKIILRTIKPLFLDDLWEEFEKSKKNINKLKEFHKKLGKLKFFDPACGCGNFLVITYREIRNLELEVIKLLNKNGSEALDSSLFSVVDVDQFYGIEIEEFPAKIAETALWLMDHIANIELSKDLGQYFVRIPLKKQATIVHENALKVSWEEVLNGNYSPKGNLAGLENLMTNNDSVAEGLSLHNGETGSPLQQNWQNQQIYIIGNPPFVGSRLQSKEQRNEMKEIFSGVNGAGVMDYVTAWYIKAGELLNQNPKIEAAFVSTNSISQGEQVGILWGEMFKRFGVEIKFAHKSFSWTSEARGKAQVTVIIIGFRVASSVEAMPSSPFSSQPKILFTYPDLKAEPVPKTVKNINPYLVEADNVVITKRSKPICNVPEIVFGNMPNDGGNFLFTEQEKQEFIAKEPEAEKYIKPLLSAKEYLNGQNRWCLWLKDVLPTELKKLPLVMERVEKVKELRLSSSREATRKLGEFPMLFGEIRQPDTDYILIPRVSSERRKYIPISLFQSNFIAGDTCLIVPNVNLYHFGVLTSKMHMAWVKYTCGRMKSDYRYSNLVVYNNFPWSGVDGEIPNKPELKNENLKTKIEKCAKEVLEIRAKFKDTSLADLYDPLAMPPELTKAHQILDKAVDEAYLQTIPLLRGGNRKVDGVFSKKTSFKDDVERVEWLFEIYKGFNG